MKQFEFLRSVAVSAAVALAAPAAVLAQTAQPAPSAEEVSGEEIEAFVVAFRSVAEIDAEYAPQFAEASDESELQSLQEEAQLEMTEAVDETPGIDVQRYVEILTLARADPELGARIVDLIER